MRRGERGAGRIQSSGVEEGTDLPVGPPLDVELADVEVAELLEEAGGHVEAVVAAAGALVHDGGSLGDTVGGDGDLGE